MLEDQSVENIHISIVQRGRKHNTIVTKLNNKINSKKFVKYIKINRNVGGSIIDDNTLIFQGDIRKYIKQILIDNRLYDESNIIVHGY